MMINTDMVPIEESLRILLVDVVRRCHSTVTDSFRVRRVSSEDFEEYTRRALPRLLETNLETMVLNEMVSMEENLRRLLVDVVRRCQSTVAESHRGTRLRRSMPHANPPISPSGETYPINSQLIAPTTACATPEFVRSPPHENVEAGPSCPRPPEGIDASEPFPNQLTDSGYGSSRVSWHCNCPVGVGTDQDINGLLLP